MLLAAITFAAVAAAPEPQAGQAIAVEEGRTLAVRTTVGDSGWLTVEPDEDGAIMAAAYDVGSRQLIGTWFADQGLRLTFPRGEQSFAGRRVVVVAVGDGTIRTSHDLIEVAPSDVTVGWRLADPGWGQSAVPVDPAASGMATSSPTVAARTETMVVAQAFVVEREATGASRTEGWMCAAGAATSCETTRLEVSESGVALEPQVVVRTNGFELAVGRGEQLELRGEVWAPVRRLTNHRLYWLLASSEIPAPEPSHPDHS